MIRTVIDNSLLNEHNSDYNYCTWINNSSVCVYLSKIENIFRSVLNKENSNKCIEMLNGAINDIVNFRPAINKNDRKILNAYSDTWCGSRVIVERFTRSVNNETLYRCFQIKYIGNKRLKGQRGYKTAKNIIIDFNYDSFIAETGIIAESCIYENAYRHYFMLLYVLWIMRMLSIEIPPKESIFPVLYNNINSSVTTGMEVFSEYETDYSFPLLFDELTQVNPINRNFVFSLTPDNFSIVYKIKNYSEVARRFAQYLNNNWTEFDVGRFIKNYSSPNKKYRIKGTDVINIGYDKELDRATYSELRIIQGSSENRMKVILKLSGQRIINRLFSYKGNVNTNVKAHKLQEYTYMSDNLVAFALWIFLNSTQESRNNFSEVQPSDLLPYITFINEYKNQREQEINERGSKGKPRNIVSNTCTIIMLSKLPPDEQENYINSIFKDTDTQQKTLVRNGINRINELQSQLLRTEPYVSLLIEDLEHEYKW